MKKISRSIPWILLIALGCWVGMGCGGKAGTEAEEPIIVAVAANLRPVAEKWKTDFEAQTGHAVEVVIGSSGKLYAQIEQGAPYHFFFSADQEYLNKLQQKGLAGQPTPYALGQLGFWINRAVALDAGMTTVPWDSIRHFAIPDPELAPYGRAAKQVLQRLEVWEELETRIVYGESVGKTALLMQTGAVDAGLTAYSVMLDTAWQKQGTTLEVSGDLHEGVYQSYAILQHGKAHPQVQPFLAYLHSPAAERALTEFGYGKVDANAATGQQNATEPHPLDFQPFLLSGLLALATTLSLLLIGIPMAWWLAKPGGRWKAVPEVLVTLPLILPPTVIGFYLLLAMSPESWLGGAFYRIFGMDLSFSFLGLWVASMVYSLPFMVNPLVAGFRQMPVSLTEAGIMLGLNRWQILRKVMLPNLWGTVGSAAIFTFAHTVGEFGVVLMIGGSVPGTTRVVSIALYEEVETLQYANAHIYAVILLAFSFITLLLARILSQGKKHTPI